MVWNLTNRGDQDARRLADKHYNRQNVGSPHFIPPGRCVVLLSTCKKAVWVTSWPYAEYVRHKWAGAWVNTLFRNTGAGLSSELINEAVAVTLSVWREPPELGIVSFVDSTKIRTKRDPGRCYRKAGWEHVGFTQTKCLYTFQLLPHEMPPPKWPDNHISLDAVFGT